MRLIATILTTIAASAAAQTPDASLQFEVASIKPSPPLASGRMRMQWRGGPGTDDPGLFTCENWPVSQLILQAFDLQDYQLVGPDWMQSARFTVSAKVPEGSSKEQFRMMMRNLLMDRLKLRFHYEKKETQGYALVIAKNGLKMKESASALDPEERPGRLTERKTDAEGFPVLPPGRVPMQMVMAGGHSTARHADETMKQFAADLGNEVGHPVTDETGLKGKYDFTLRWIGQSVGPSASADDTGPNIFRALQEQLGLKLESKKEMVDILVVDHIEKTPTEN
jgi:uncharacterized protein (TIGR03435 family)